ncbi:hypothetical protein [Streptomyces sp. NBC_00470]|uniref:hypothetical protein n=1 Tax=Streptomyces sp. NBC_00470 TaxID=2975753 RepID=UPI0030E27C34
MVRAVEADITHFDRKTFLAEVWDYSAGEHVTVLGPTGSGKTYLAYELLRHSVSETLPAVVLVMKPKDPTALGFSTSMKFPIVRDWPPPQTKRLFSDGKPRGWTLWPKFAYDPAIDNARHRGVFRRAILDCYRKGNRSLFADETYSLEEELGLSEELRTVWTKGRSMECGLWAASQRPAYISKWAYQAHHLFLSHDPDVDAQNRLSEIGGAVDPGKVRWMLPRLQKHEWLYVNRDERAMCVVGK